MNDKQLVITKQRKITQLPGGLMRIGRKQYVAHRFNVVAALQVLDDGEPKSIGEFAEIFVGGNTKLARRKVKGQIRRLIKHQFNTPRPVIGTYETLPNGDPLANGRLIKIRLFSGSGSVEETQELDALRKRKETFGKKLLGEAEHLMAIQQEFNL